MGDTACALDVGWPIFLPLCPSPSADTHTHTLAHGMVISGGQLHLHLAP